jgi:ethanolamine utilization protein EutN
MIVQPLDEERLPKGPPIVAADTIGIGVGELGLCTGGREAAMALPEPFTPVDCAVVGIVDNLDVEKEKIS